MVRNGILNDTKRYIKWYETVGPSGRAYPMISSMGLPGYGRYHTVSYHLIYRFVPTI